MPLSGEVHGERSLEDMPETTKTLPDGDGLQLGERAEQASCGSSCGMSGLQHDGHERVCCGEGRGTQRRQRARKGGRVDRQGQGRKTRQQREGEGTDGMGSKQQNLFGLTRNACSRNYAWTVSPLGVLQAL